MRPSCLIVGYGGGRRGQIGTLAAYIMMTLSLIWPVTAKGFVLSVTREATTAAGGIAESRRPREIFDGPAEQPEDNYLSNAATDFVTPSAELR
jgi:hypothetical protein